MEFKSKVTAPSTIETDSLDTLTTKGYVDDAIENVELLEGPQGPPGEKGEQGVQGPQGTPGIKGDIGDRWKPTVNAAGLLTWAIDNTIETPASQNIKGPQGEQGIQGIQGVQGPIGKTGPSGSDANVVYANIIAGLGYVPMSTGMIINGGKPNTQF